MNAGPSTKAESGSPKSSPARKVVLLLLLLATIIVVALEYLPEQDSGTKLVGPTKKTKPAVQNPSQPQRQQPTVPRQPAPTPLQPQESPAPAPSTPPYERPPTTVFVSSSPSDQPVATSDPQEAAAAIQPVAGEATPVAAQTDTAIASVSPSQPDVGPLPSMIPAEDHQDSVLNVGTSAPTGPALLGRPLPVGTIPTKVDRYSRRLIDRYDTNRDGVIDATEQRQMQGQPARIDYDADGWITRDELAAYTADFGRNRRMRLTGSMVEEAVAVLPPFYVPTAERDAQAAALAAAKEAADEAAREVSQPTEAIPVALSEEVAEEAAAEPDDEATSADEESADGEEGVDDGTESEQPEPASPPVAKRFATPKSRLAGLPGWFLARDTNGDGQLTVAEYAPNSEKSSLADFARSDRNNDGVLTAQECPK